MHRGVSRPRAPATSRCSIGVFTNTRVQSAPLPSLRFPSMYPHPISCQAKTCSKNQGWPPNPKVNGKHSKQILAGATQTVPAGPGGLAVW